MEDTDFPENRKPGVPTTKVLGMELPIIAELGEGWFLVAHPIGVAIANKHSMYALSFPSAEMDVESHIPEAIRADAVEQFEKLAWPLVRAQFYEPDVSPEEEELIASAQLGTLPSRPTTRKTTDDTGVVHNELTNKERGIPVETGPYKFAAEAATDVQVDSAELEYYGPAATAKPALQMLSQDDWAAAFKLQGQPSPDYIRAIARIGLERIKSLEAEIDRLQKENIRPGTLGGAEDETNLPKDHEPRAIPGIEL